MNPEPIISFHIELFNPIRNAWYIVWDDAGDELTFGTLAEAEHYVKEMLHMDEPKDIAVDVRFIKSVTQQCIAKAYPFG